MAYICVLGGGECIGCGDCKPEPKPAGEDVFGTEIYPDDYYYDIGGDIIAEDNIHDYLDQFKKLAGGSKES